MRRHICALVTLLIVVLSLSGCSSKQKAGDQVELILEQVKTVQIDANLKDYFKSKALDKEYADEYEQLIEKIKDFDYKVVKEDVNDDKTEATVVVQITTYDYASAYDKTEKMVIEQAEKEKLDRSSNVADYVHRTLFQNLLALESKDKVTEVSIHCVLNSDGDWVPEVENSTELINAILGDLMNDQELELKLEKEAEEAGKDKK